ncbi:MAG: UpxY family transcription antiterminator [Muribaculaceae bacterium]|nr:UpxY family transcription antiterminator [Muribaculaceae bacterium]
MEQLNENSKPAGQAPESKVWYAIRVTYNRELKVKDDLDARGIECFIPMKQTLVLRRGRRVKKLVPTIHNLIFFHIEPSAMKQYKATTKLPIRYIMNPATKQPVVVPEDQMNSFIAVAGSYDEQLEYIQYDARKFTRGDRVRIMGGPFEGAEGVLRRVKGSQRVVVCIEGVVAVITTDIHPSLLEKLPTATHRHS